VSDPAFRVDLRRDRISVDGRRALPTAPQYWMLHKPAGYVTTRRDPDRRATVHDLLPPNLPHLSAVGRLDLDSSGLLLLTNDTQLGACLTDPDSHVAKIYEVRLEAPITPAEAARLAAGVLVLGRRTRPAEIELLGAAPARRVRVTLVEGRNRQVRRMFATAGRRVEKLHRIGIGPLELAGLAPGTARPLRAAELRALRTAAFRKSWSTTGS
jgi:23S rRNA pseudouridine2605 synthase